MAALSAQTFIRPEDFWRDVGLRANQTVVHLGCGPGFYLVPAAKIVGRNGHVIGVDVREDMLRETENRAARENVAETVTTVHADLETGDNQKIDTNIADWTLVANILYQADPTKILAQAARITRPTGTVVVVEWETAATPLGPPDEDRLTKPEIINLANKQHLVLREEFIPSPYHFGLSMTLESSASHDTPAQK